VHFGKFHKSGKKEKKKGMDGIKVMGMFLVRNKSVPEKWDDWKCTGIISEKFMICFNLKISVTKS
jgi:hypothetical protein